MKLPGINIESIWLIASKLSKHVNLYENLLPPRTVGTVSSSIFLTDCLETNQWFFNSCAWRFMQKKTRKLCSTKRTARARSKSRHREYIFELMHATIRMCCSTKQALPEASHRQRWVNAVFLRSRNITQWEDVVQIGLKIHGQKGIRTTIYIRQREWERDQGSEQFISGELSLSSQYILPKCTSLDCNKLNA